MEGKKRRKKGAHCYWLHRQYIVPSSGFSIWFYQKDEIIFFSHFSLFIVHFTGFIWGWGLNTAIKKKSFKQYRRKKRGNSAWVIPICFSFRSLFTRNEQDCKRYSLCHFHMCSLFVSLKYFISGLLHLYSASPFW